MADALRKPVRFLLTGGETYDLVGADHLLPSMIAGTLTADQACGADKWVIELLTAAGRTLVIPPKANGLVSRNYDGELCIAGHRIESLFARLKQFRTIASRYDKTRNFLGAIHLVAAVIRLN